MEDVRQKKNFRMIQKFVPGATEIKDQALFVAVYAFNEAEQNWDKEEIEGPLFLVERTAGVNGKAESGALVVVNRASSVNLIRYIASDFEYDATDQYLMFRCPEGIYGLWFPDAQERSRVIGKLEEMISTMKQRESASKEMPALLQQMFLNEKEKQDLQQQQQDTAPPSFSGPNADQNFQLSKEQMKDVLLRLVQTDKFIDILHSTYLKSIQSKNIMQPMQPHGHGHGHHIIAPSPLRQPPPPHMYHHQMGMYGVPPPHHAPESAMPHYFASSSQHHPPHPQ